MGGGIMCLYLSLNERAVVISALLIKKFQNNLQIQKLCLPLHPQSRTNDCKVGAIAQLVEQRTENPCVPGSIPGGTT